jgi:hypothetical protein
VIVGEPASTTTENPWEKRVPTDAANKIGQPGVSHLIEVSTKRSANRAFVEDYLLVFNLDAADMACANFVHELRPG